MRALARGLVAVVLLAGCGASTGAGPVDIDTGSMAGMVLHLPDGPAGAVIGDDSHCGGTVGGDGQRDALVDLAVEAGGQIATCLVQLEAPDTVVDSLVLSYPSPEVARQAVSPDVLAAVVRSQGLDCCSADPVGDFAEAGGPGEEALLAVSAADSSAVLGWRSGSLIGVVSVLHLDGAPGAAREAARLGEVQQERMLHPAPLPDGIDDDRLVGLQRAGFTVWWVGETFAPIGLPPMPLVNSYAQEGMVELDYRGARIQAFDLGAVPAGSEPDQMLGLATELFDSPCTVVEPIDGPGTALLLGRHLPEEYLVPPAGGMRDGWGELTTGDCPAGEPNVWMATVDVDGIHIRVNPPICYNCLAPPAPDRPFQASEGLRAIVAALEPYAG